MGRSPPRTAQAAYRIAAYSTSTGALITSFAPSLDATVNTLTATNTTVYVGGEFGVGQRRRPQLSRRLQRQPTARCCGWAPTADDVVDAMVLTPDGTHVIVGGAFAT